MDTMFKQISEAFEDYDNEALLEILKTALDAGVQPVELVGELSKCMDQIGLKFSQGELFLPDMVMAGDLMEECLGFLKPILAAQNENVPVAARVVLGTVKGDVHDIGKNMVKTMLSISGFEIIDLGTDVSAEQFYNTVVEEKPDFLALSSCMTTTVPSMRDTLDLIRARKLDQTTMVVVGGGSVTPQLAQALGNCTYGGKDAFAAVSVFRQCLKDREERRG